MKRKIKIDNIHAGMYNGHIVEVFTFHISDLELASIEQQDFNHLLSVCLYRDIDFKVVHSRISSTDMSIKVYVFSVPDDVFNMFHVYNIRPVY